jgi:hypothetical protein
MSMYLIEELYPQVHARDGGDEAASPHRRTDVRTTVPADAGEACDAGQIQMPLRSTLDWAAHLPDGVLPSALMCRHARVADLIAAMWNDPEALRDYLDVLLSPDGRRRRELAPDIIAELTALQSYYEAMEPITAWGSVGSRD